MQSVLRRRQRFDILLINRFRWQTINELAVFPRSLDEVSLNPLHFLWQKEVEDVLTFDLGMAALPIEKKFVMQNVGCLPQCFP